MLARTGGGPARRSHAFARDRHVSHMFVAAKNSDIGFPAGSGHVPLISRIPRGATVDRGNDSGIVLDASTNSVFRLNRLGSRMAGSSRIVAGTKAPVDKRAAGRQIAGVWMVAGMWAERT